MRWIDEFRNIKLAQGIVEKIRKLYKDLGNRKLTLMEVCGTHTVAMFKHGIKTLLADIVNMLSGPGCPVCVTPTEEIDYILALVRDDKNNNIITTFGDMMKVPGSRSSLEKEKANGADIRIVYSSLDALRIAIENPNKRVIFFAVGFETTSPTVAVTIKEAYKKNINNFYILSAHKLIPPAIGALLKLGKVQIDGFILPGHVSTIIGATPYEFICKDYHIPCVISGFEPLDILQSIYMLLKQHIEKKPKVEIQYTRSVCKEGNLKALQNIYEVFEVCEGLWRGIGKIPNSALGLKKHFLQFDVKNNFNVKIEDVKEPKGCICGAILCGIKTPYDCPLFATSCTPDTPIGPCMVSSEGACSTFYKYKY